MDRYECPASMPQSGSEAMGTAGGSRLKCSQPFSAMGVRKVVEGRSQSYHDHDTQMQSRCAADLASSRRAAFAIGTRRLTDTAIQESHNASDLDLRVDSRA